MMREPIKKIKLMEFKTERDSRYLDAKIDNDGNLVLEGYDIGDSVEEFWGDSDYEYWLTVSQEYKDTVLLLLIQERFESSSEFKMWLESKEIPHKFDSWV
jgi:hypothetical protein